MKIKLISFFILICALITVITGVLFFEESKKFDEEKRAKQVLDINEIEKLAESGDTELMRAKAAELKESIRAEKGGNSVGSGIIILGGACILIFGGVFLYMYFSILKPFDKLKSFAAKIAHGDLEVPLRYDRSNYFGAFTWAFDNMRNEIIKARACEKEASENNKTVIATLSHDIRTPIASIRAYTEALEANMDSTAEKRQKYLSVIMSKCDEVSRLTDDLLLHSVSDMDRLKINLEIIELTEFIEKAVNEIETERRDINYERPDFKIQVNADRKRLLQVMENLVNNSRKYGKSEIDIFIERTENIAEIHFKDYGNGIPDEDMPFIFNKFYRGKNCGEEQGSGLGLYIVKYIAEKMGGKVRAFNHSKGLEVIFTLPLLDKN